MRGGARPGAGAPRLPDAVKKQRGTFRPDRAVPDAIRPPRAPVPDPPAELAAEERAWWRALAEAVNAVGVYTAADLYSFRMLVRNYALMEAIHAGKVMEEDRQGEPKVVSVTSVVSLTRLVSGLLTHFGLDPSSRDKLIPAPRADAEEPTEDPDDFSSPVQ